ncbi:cilia- and flagella-associated protein 58 isoform X1 [Tachysurus ichikawai]
MGKTKELPQKLREEIISSHLKGLVNEMHHIQNELLKERARCKSLQEELENPMNVHCWRRLEGSDPRTFELIQRTHSLQRHLIAQTRMVAEKEFLLKEKEKEYIELKHKLARMPGPEAADKLWKTQQTLKEKNKQLIVLSVEVNMYKSQAMEYKKEIEQLDEELKNVKKRKDKK